MNKYIATKKGGKRIDEHRLVMQNYLGRELTVDEIVHHIDGDKSNNKIDNLMLFLNKAEHTRHHIYLGDLKLKCGENKKKLIDGKLKCFHCNELKEIKRFVTKSDAYLGVIGVCKKCRSLQRKK